MEWAEFREISLKSLHNSLSLADGYQRVDPLWVDALLSINKNPNCYTSSCCQGGHWKEADVKKYEQLSGVKLPPKTVDALNKAFVTLNTDEANLYHYLKDLFLEYFDNYGLIKRKDRICELCFRVPPSQLQQFQKELIEALGNYSSEGEEKQ